jgi:glyoxylase-like metal-dependent hydrolase (beta-lactamase superfamily II)
MTKKPSKQLRVLLAALSLSLTSALLATPAHAQAPMAKTQVPGYYRIMVGSIEVTALLDGVMQLDKSLLQNAKDKELNRALDRMFVGNPKMGTAVNAYLINTGKNLVLVDAGAAGLFGPSLGNLAQNMKAAGYSPEQVDHIVITHLHADHVGGINDPSGKPLFPNALVSVSQAENDFWLSKEIAAKAPPAMQSFFQMAQASAAPYQASGQWKPLAGDGTGEIVPGITAVNASGHTPGHRIYVVESQGQRLVITGDMLHAHAIQFANPGVAIQFDADQKKAIALRRDILKRVADEKSFMSGAHLPFPGIGHVISEGKGSYRWVPVEFSPMPTSAAVASTADTHAGHAH